MLLMEAGLCFPLLSQCRTGGANRDFEKPPEAELSVWEARSGPAFAESPAGHSPLSPPRVCPARQTSSSGTRSAHSRASNGCDQPEASEHVNFVPKKDLKRFYGLSKGDVEIFISILEHSQALEKYVLPQPPNLF